MTSDQAPSGDAARQALEWYALEAEAIARAMQADQPKPDAAMAAITVLSLDAGKRARAALAQQSPPESRSTWKTTGSKCDNCGKGILAHENQTYCPAQQSPPPLTGVDRMRLTAEILDPPPLTDAEPGVCLLRGGCTTGALCMRRPRCHPPAVAEPRDLAGYVRRTPHGGGLEIVDWIECYGCQNVKACAARSICHDAATQAKEGK